MAPVQSTLRNLALIEEDVIIAGATLLAIKRRKKKKNRRWLVHPIMKQRRQQGAFHTLARDMETFEDKFHEYYRMTREQFAQVLYLIRQEITKQHHSRDDVISPRERLSLTIR